MPTIIVVIVSHCYCYAAAAVPSSFVIAIPQPLLSPLCNYSCYALFTSRQASGDANVLAHGAAGRILNPERGYSTAQTGV